MGFGDDAYDSTWFIWEKLKDAWIAVNVAAAAAAAYAAKATTDAAKAAKNVAQLRAAFAAADKALAAAAAVSGVNPGQVAAAQALLKKLGQAIAQSTGKAATKATSKKLARLAARLARLLALIIAGYVAFQIAALGIQKGKDWLLSWGKTNEEPVEVGTDESVEQATNKTLRQAYEEMLPAFREAAGEYAEYVPTFDEAAECYKNDPAERVGYGFAVASMRLALHTYQFIALAAQGDPRFKEIGTVLLPSDAKAVDNATVNFAAELEDAAHLQLYLTLTSEDVGAIMSAADAAGGLKLPRIEEIAFDALLEAGGLAPIDPIKEEIVQDLAVRAALWTESERQLTLRDHLTLVAEDWSAFAGTSLVPAMVDALAHSPHP